MLGKEMRVGQGIETMIGESSYCWLLYNKPGDHHFHRWFETVDIKIISTSQFHHLV